MGKIAIITGPSGSGKTTLQQELLNKGWVAPINYTTRNPRNDEELDNYVFISKEQFCTKLINGDFLEFTVYNGNFYGVSNTLDDKHNWCIILDPIGRSQIMEKFARNNTKYNLFYLQLDEQKLTDRLMLRGDKKEDIEKRLLDIKWFEPTRHSTILDGEATPEHNANLVEKLTY